MVTHAATLSEDLTLTIPRSIASKLGMKPNTPVEITDNGFAIIISRVDDGSELTRPLSQITDENTPTHLDFGPPVGGELW